MGFFRKSKSVDEKLSSAIEKNNIQKVKSVLKSATKKKNFLKVNDRKCIENNYFVKAIDNNNADIIKALIDYINTHNFSISFNGSERNPLYYAAKNNNYTIVYLLVEYSKKHNIKLNLDEYG